MCPQFCELVWLMVAQSKGWKITKKQVQLVLESVQQLSELKWRDPVPNIKIEKFQNPLLKDHSPLIRPFLASIVLRLNHGGMKGDMEMLQKYIILWNERYSKNAEFWEKERETWFADLSKNTPQIEELISSGPVLSDEDQILEGIDFHCFPKLLDRCFNDLKDPVITKDDIKKCVWFHRSGINLKKAICDPNDPYSLKTLDSLETEISSRKETQQNWDKISVVWLKLCEKTYWTPIKIN
uniref:Uncharacterized protein n=1 Tax=Arcella intermedia TaxID=1963864 RepID=A0A6B2LEY8_9EUKA